MFRSPYAVALLLSTLIACKRDTPATAVESPAPPATSVTATASASAAVPSPAASEAGTPPAPYIKTVFIILMENHAWATIKAKQGSSVHSTAHWCPWAPTRSNTSPRRTCTPASPTTSGWKPATTWASRTITRRRRTTRAPKSTCRRSSRPRGSLGRPIPRASTARPARSRWNGLTIQKHTPQLFFDDVTDTNNPASKHCIEHVRPYSELATDLQGDKVARYNFITPDLCNDMHGAGPGSKCSLLSGDAKMIKNGDDWLSVQVPMLLASRAYNDGGLVIVLWDEAEDGPAEDGPIPAIFLSKNVKKNYASNTKFTHSSMLRTLQTIFGVPYLRGAQTATDMSELFSSFP